MVRKVFAAQHMSVQLRLRLFQSLVLSVLFYNSELWTPSRTHIQWLHTFYLRAVRRIAHESRFPIPGKPRLSDLALLQKLQLPSVDNILRRRRLLYISSLICKPYPALQALLLPHSASPSPWSQRVLADLQAIPRLAPPPARRDLDVLGDPRSAKGAAAWTEFIAADWWKWKRLARDVTVGSAPFADDSTEPLTVPCPECAKLFSSSKAVATHRMRVHGHRKPVASVIPAGATTCPACSKVFATTRQLLDHAQYRARKCRDVILAL